MDACTRREAVNTLALKAKTNDTVVPELWDMVVLFVNSICARYCRIEKQARFYEYEDLCQAAFFGFKKAINAYDSSRGAFSTLLGFYVRNTCRTEIKKYMPETDPINAAASLDKPLEREDGDGCTMVDFLLDETAEEAYDIFLDEDKAQIVLNEVEKLNNPLYVRIIRECTFQGRTLESLANELGISRQAIYSAQKKAILILQRRQAIKKNV
jgi:RNA polymerase sigma factor (sigma-70 family)